MQFNSGVQRVVGDGPLRHHLQREWREGGKPAVNEWCGARHSVTAAGPAQPALLAYSS